MIGMDVTPLVKEGSKIIQSYGGGNFRVSGEVYEGAAIVSVSDVSLWDAPESVEDLSLKHFEALQSFQGQFDVVLFGTGSKLVFPSAEFRMELKQNGLHAEFMDSGAACRTYNVLMAEGRRVVALLMPVP